MRKSEFSIEFTTHWISLVQENNFDSLKDPVGAVLNYCFLAHGCEQSILPLVGKKSQIK